LEVELEHALAELADPVAGLDAVLDHVAAIEIGADGGRLELIDVLDELLRLGDEVVPDDLDGDLEVEVRGEGDGLLDLGGGAVPALRVDDVLVDDAGHEQHGVGAVDLGVLEGAGEGGQAPGAYRLVGAGEGVLPVDRVDDAVDGDAG